MGIELRGIEVRWDGSDKIVSAIVTVDHPDMYEKRELYRNKPVTRGLLLKALNELYNVHPADIIWPSHIKAMDI